MVAELITVLITHDGTVATGSLSVNGTVFLSTFTNVRNTVAPFRGQSRVPNKCPLAK